MKKRNLVLALAFTAAAALTACSGGSGEAASGQNQEEEQAEKEGENEAGEEAREEEEPQEEAAETAKANWTIDEAIAAIEDKLGTIERQIEANATNSVRLKELREEQEKTQEELAEKMERGGYLNDLAEKIAGQGGPLTLILQEIQYL